MSLIKLIIFIVSAVITIFFIEFTWIDNNSNERIILIARTMISLYAIILGFLLTSLSVLVGLSDRKLIQNMRNSNSYSAHVNRIKTSLILICFVIFFNVIILFLNCDLVHFLALAIGFTVFTSMYVFESLRKYLKILSYVK